MKENYSYEPIKLRLSTIPVWFMLWKPIKPPYFELADRAKAGFIRTDYSYGMVEKAPFAGKWWIGYNVPEVLRADGTIARSTTIENEVLLIGNFAIYTFTGPYKELKNVYKQIQKDNPEAREFYNCYMNDVRDVGEKGTITKIIFR